MTEIDNEHILVCVSRGHGSEQLIRTGWELANVFHAPLTILTVDSGDDDKYTASKAANLAMWEAQARQLQAHFVSLDSDGRSVAQTIIEVAKERQVTQIVLGQCAQSRWEECTKGSIINKILRKIEFVDIHIASIQRDLQQEEVIPESRRTETNSGSYALR